MTSDELHAVYAFSFRGTGGERLTTKAVQPVQRVGWCACDSRSDWNNPLGPEIVLLLFVYYSESGEIKLWLFYFAIKSNQEPFVQEEERTTFQSQ